MREPVNDFERAARCSGFQRLTSRAEGLWIRAASKRGVPAGVHGQENCLSSDVSPEAFSST